MKKMKNKCFAILLLIPLFAISQNNKSFFIRKDFMDDTNIVINVYFQNMEYNFPDSGNLSFTNISQLNSYIHDMNLEVNDTIINEYMNGFIYYKKRQVIIKDSDDKYITLTKNSELELETILEEYKKYL